jgi:hypothetical protein
VLIDNSEGQEVMNGSYAVGTNNVNAHGDQSKRFVSKRANIWTNNGEVTIRFNDSRNIAIPLPPKLCDLNGIILWYEKEFHANIASVYYSVPATFLLYMYFEGVLPEEARDAE